MQSSLDEQHYRETCQRAGGIQRKGTPSRVLAVRRLRSGGFAIAMAVMMVSFISTSDGPPRMDVMFIWVGLLMIPVIGALAAAVVRRLHDRGLSGAWGLLPLPFLAFAFFAMHRAAITMQTEDPGSVFDTAFASGMLYDISLIVLIVLLAGRSDEGANRFGPTPDVR